MSIKWNEKIFYRKLFKKYIVKVHRSGMVVKRNLGTNDDEK